MLFLYNFCDCHKIFGDEIQNLNIFSFYTHTHTYHLSERARRASSSHYLDWWGLISNSILSKGFRLASEIGFNKCNIHDGGIRWWVGHSVLSPPSKWAQQASALHRRLGLGLKFTFERGPSIVGDINWQAGCLIRSGAMLERKAFGLLTPIEMGTSGIS